MSKYFSKIFYKKLHRKERTNHILTINLITSYPIRNTLIVMKQDKIKNPKRPSLVYKVLDYMIILNLNQPFKTYSILNHHQHLNSEDLFI